jgi:peptide/nickel transport system substrate-binding protein
MEVIMQLASLRHEFPSGRICLAVLAILFALCAGPASAASEPSAVTIVLNAEPHSLDPGQITAANVGQVVKQNIVETLTEVNPDDSSITPRLATSWKQIDKSTWHFFLRKGVKFHDGEDFNAKAAIFNIVRMHNSKVTSSTLSSIVKMEGKALDSHTLEVKTDKPEPLLPALMGLLVICSPNTPSDKLTRQPIGTGPYKLVRWDAGTQINLERFEGYWGTQPQVKKAVYIWRTESAVRAAMVEVGEADLVLEIARQDANRTDLDCIYGTSETTVLYVSTWIPPLNDRRVRMALNYAIDRNAIRGSILSKAVVPATHLVVPSIFGYNPELKVWPYDPQKAKQLLAEARKDGVPVDKEIFLAGRIGQFSGDQELMEAVMTMYKAIGLNVYLKMLEVGVSKQYENKPFPPNVGPFILQGMHDNNKGDPAFTVFNKYHCDGRGSHMCDKSLDELFEKARVAAGEERRNLWRAAFKRIHEEIIPDVMLFHMVGYTRIGKRIAFKPSLALSSELQLAQITFK